MIRTVTNDYDGSAFYRSDTGSSTVSSRSQSHSFTTGNVSSTGSASETEEAVFEFHEILDEGDYGAIAELAQRGIPDEVRGDVWKALLAPGSRRFIAGLGTQFLAPVLNGSDPFVAAPVDPIEHGLISSRSPPDESTFDFNMSLRMKEQNLDPVQLKRIRSELRRFKWKLSSTGFPESDRLRIVEDLIITYIHDHMQIKGSMIPATSLVHLCIPVVYSSRNEEDAQLVFGQLMERVEHHFVQHCVEERMARFYSLFRLLLPDLYHYFEEVQVRKDMIGSWLQNLLAKELPLNSVLLLWDSYLSHPDGLDLHEYVCLSVLFRCKEQLFGLGTSEIHGFLCRLPGFLQMNQLILHAQNLKREIERMKIF